MEQYLYGNIDQEYRLISSEHSWKPEWQRGLSQQEYGDSFLQKLCIRFHAAHEMFSGMRLEAEIPECLTLPASTPPGLEIMATVLDGLYSSKRIVIVIEETGGSFYMLIFKVPSQF